MFNTSKLTDNNLIKNIVSKFSEQERTFIIRTFVLGLSIRIGLLFVGYIIGRSICKYDNPLGELIYLIFYRWDARAFQYLSEFGYQNFGIERTYLAYFPLYPAIMHIFNYFMPTTMTSALWVSSIFGLWSGYYIQKLVAIDYDDEMVKRTFAFYYLFPTAYFLFVPYTESLFIFLVITSFYYMRQKNWMLSCILASLAGATRLQGLVMIPVILIELWQNRKEVKFRNTLWLLVVPFGFLTYLFINWHITGNAFEFLKIQKEFFSHNNILPTEQITETLKHIINDKPSEYRTLLFEMRFVTIIATILLLAISFKWMRTSYQFYGWSQILILMTDSWLMSLPRYVLAIFPLFITLARISNKPEVFQFMIVISAIIMSGFYSLYAAGHWAF